jgi:hypothetical protein
VVVGFAAAVAVGTVVLMLPVATADATAAGWVTAHECPPPPDKRQTIMNGSSKNHEEWRKNHEQNALLTMHSV